MANKMDYTISDRVTLMKKMPCSLRNHLEDFHVLHVIKISIIYKEDQQILVLGQNFPLGIHMREFLKLGKALVECFLTSNLNSWKNLNH
jgi:hypothetical protein